MQEEKNDGSKGERATTTLRLPAFDPVDVELWFMQAENLMEIAGINDDMLRHRLVVAALDRRTLGKVKSAVKPAAKDKPYWTLKAALEDLFQENEAAKFKRFLEGKTRGDRSCVEFVADCHQLTGKSPAADAMILQFLLREVPECLRAFVADCKDEVEVAAKRADDILVKLPSETKRPTIAAVEPPRAAASAADEPPAWAQTLIESITKVVAGSRCHACGRSDDDDRRPRDQQQQRGGRNRSRSRSRGAQPNDGLCYYHRKFGDNARLCRPECKFYNLPKNA